MQRVCLVVIILVGAAVPRPGSSYFYGRVTSDSGLPVVHALVQSRGSFAVTDRAGKFRLKMRPRVIFVEKPGFVPLAHLIQLEEKYFDLVLQQETPERQQHFPGCPADITSDVQAARDHNLISVFDLWAPLPPTLHEEVVGRSVDTAHKQTYRPEAPSFALQTWSGVGAPYFPDDEYFIRSSTWSVQSISNLHPGVLPGTIAAQWRGRLENGHTWRWIVLPFTMDQGGPAVVRTTVFYFDLPEESATYFDRLLDQICELPKQ